MTEARAHRWAGPTVIVAVLLTFSYTLMCDFVYWDDNLNVTNYDNVRDATWSSIIYHWTHAEYGIYVPLVFTSWSILGIIGRVSPDAFGVPLNPMIFHAFNVLVHAVAAWAVFSILKELFKDAAAACLGALVFALHPFQVESVAWVSGLKDTQCGALSLLSIWQFILFRQRAGRQSKRHYALFLFCFALALCSKPSAMTLPAVIAVIDVLLLKTAFRRSLIALLPTVLLVIPVMAVAKNAQPAYETVSPLMYRPLIVFDSIAFYLSKIAIPFNFAADYSRSPSEVIASGALYYTWLVPVFVGGAALWLFRSRRSRVPLAAFLVFVLAPFHVLGLARFDFQRLSTVADHYMYLAMLGPACLSAWWLATTAHPKRLYIVFGTIVAVWGALSFVQSTHWQNEETLMLNTLRVNPASKVAVTNLSHWYAKTGDRDASRHYLRKAYERDKDNPVVLENRGQFALADGDIETARASYTRLAEMMSHPRKLANIAEIFGDYGYLDDALPYLQKAEQREFNDAYVRRVRDKIRQIQKQLSTTRPTTVPVSRP